MKLIKLSKNKFAKVDDEDFEYLNKWKWSVSSNNYAVRRVSRKLKGKNNIIILMHRQIMKTNKNMQTDHINQNKLDNQKSNLRMCTRSENSCNRLKRKNTSSKYKGVCWDKAKKKWVAQVWKDNVKVLNKRFPTEKEAAIAYNKKSKIFHKEFAILNNV